MDGVVIRPLTQVGDQRGRVLHVLRSDAPHFVRFGEVYLSEVEPGAVKAWKLHRQMHQNLTVPRGKVRFVLYDERAGSRTSGNILKVELGDAPNEYQLLSIPPNVWYGFECLSDHPALIVNCADMPHAPDEVERREPDDPRIPHQWRPS